jgi:hypothetical protein
MMSILTKSQLAGIALCFGAASASAATCSKLGSLGPPDIALFGNSFSSAGSYVDCFTFELSGPATSFGGVVELDPLSKLNIDVTSISLYASSGTSNWQPDTTPLAFSFGGLVGGAGVVYTLQVVSTVVAGWGFNANVGYGGTIVTLASAAPEPSAYALAIAGLAVVGFGVLRSRRR